MAILDSEKVDFLWKRILYGVTKTANASTKLASNESIPSPLPVLPSSVWKDGDTIPASPPVSTAAPVQVFTGAARIHMSADPTSPANVAWLATTTFGTLNTRAVDFIPPTFGTGYAVKVFIGDPNVGPAARIFPDTTNEEWVFDYAAGVLVFTGNIPAGKTATIGAGTVGVATHGVYIEVYRYNGSKGVGTTVTIPFIPSLLGHLADVEDGTGTPQQGQFLRWINGVWQADTFTVTIPFVPTLLGQLADVEAGTGTPAEGMVLTWKNGVWQAEPATGGVNAGDLGSMAFQDSDAVDITGGTITGVIIDGGTF